MREKRNAQTSLFDPQAVDHPVADDLERASAWLDARPELLGEIAADLGARSGSSRGRRGLSCETVPRCALLKHLRRETYRGLEFILRDSLSARRFARVEAGRLPGKSALQSTIGSIRAETRERINRRLLGAARDEKVESGDQVRVDSTVTHTHILEPSDSQLLRDGVRVLTRLLVAARDELGAEAVRFHDHRRAAKRRALEIGSRRGEAGADLSQAAAAAGAAGGVGGGDALGAGVGGDRRRIRRSARPRGGSDDAAGVRGRDGAGGGEGGEPVRAAHGHHPQGRAQDALRAQGQLRHRAQRAGAGRGGGGRQSGGQRALPADAAAACRALRRGAVAGGVRRRLRVAREPEGGEGLGVAHVVFNKKRGIKVADMTPSSWLHARLKRFRAGIEAGISCLKRCFGLGLCRWRGLPRFKAHVQSAVFAHNLLRFVRLLPRPT